MEAPRLSSSWQQLRSTAQGKCVKYQMVVVHDQDAMNFSTGIHKQVLPCESVTNIYNRVTPKSQES